MGKNSKLKKKIIGKISNAGKTILEVQNEKKTWQIKNKDKITERLKEIWTFKTAWKKNGSQKLVTTKKIPESQKKIRREQMGRKNSENMKKNSTSKN